MIARFARAVALMLLAWQAVATPAHVHAAGAPAGVATELAARSSPAPGRPDDPLSCPVCREIAHAGAYLTPSPVAYQAPAVADRWLSVAAPAPRRHVVHTHAWRSRAPPSPLLS